MQHDSFHGGYLSGKLNSPLSALSTAKPNCKRVHELHGTVSWPIKFAFPRRDTKPADGCGFTPRDVAAGRISCCRRCRDGMDVAVAAYAAHALSKSCSLDPVTLGFLFSSGLVGMAAGSLFLTPFSDKIGWRRMMLVALVLVSAGMILSVCR
jgi:hypothetical protein